MSRTLFSLAGFQVITNGRFWVIAEDISTAIKTSDSLGHARAKKLRESDVCSFVRFVVGGALLIVSTLGGVSSFHLPRNTQRKGELRTEASYACQRYISSLAANEKKLAALTFFSLG
jgi:hypothetical protein